MSVPARAVASIERVDGQTVLVVPAEKGWHHRIVKHGVGLAGYDIRLEDRREFLKAYFERSRE